MAYVRAKFKKADLLAIEDDDEPEGFEIVSEGEYVSEGKWERREIIFSFCGKNYTLVSSRSGSYYSDYYYASEDWPDEQECLEVVPVSRTITTWEMVTDNG
jgi:hypothetical protein